jgi:hypothetical protein
MPTEDGITALEDSLGNWRPVVRSPDQRPLVEADSTALLAQWREVVIASGGAVLASSGATWSKIRETKICALVESRVQCMRSPTAIAEGTSEGIVQDAIAESR